MTELTPPVGSPLVPALRGEAFWGVLDVAYGLLISILAWRFIPIETARIPALPWFLIGWGVLHTVLGSLSLISRKKSPQSVRRQIWRAHLYLSWSTLAAGVILGSLCLMSGLYWLGVFGVLGWGVFISSLLLLSGVIQLLILYPALKLRRLLSSPFRALFSGGGVALLALKITLSLPLICGLLGAYSGSLTEGEHLTQSQRDAVTAYLRSTLEGSPVTPAGSAVSADGVLNKPIKDQPASSEIPDPLLPLKGLSSQALIYVSFYAGGALIVRVSGRGHDLATATKNAASSLASHPKLSGRRLKGGRLVVDRLTGSAAIPLSWLPNIGPIILSLSVDPGRDGLRSTRGETTRTHLPSDLVVGERFAVAPIVPGIPELRFGLDSQFVHERLGPLERVSLERIRTEQWVERVELESPDDPLPSDGPLTAATLRGHWGDRSAPILPANPREALLKRRATYRETAHRAGRYLVRHQGDDGRFDYQYFPYRDEVKQPSDAKYSIPRHSGAIYGLSMLYQDQPLPEYERAAKRAIQWLQKYALPECGGWEGARTCLPNISTIDQVASLGQSALSALALLTYLKVVEAHQGLKKAQDPWLRRVDLMAEGFAHFILRMQRADGDFHHHYNIFDDSVDPSDRSMFAGEQAAFVLVLAAQRWPDGPWKAAAERALDALTIKKYEGDFLSSFFFGADHWTCLAAHAAAPLINKPEYLNFCLNYARFLQRLQYRVERGEGDLSYHGHYGFGFLSPPQAPATGGFSEGVMGALLLAEANGIPEGELADIYAQVYASAEAMTHDQITTQSRWNIKNFQRAEGAFRRSLVESEVRVDFVQHCLSSLLMIQQLKSLQSSKNHD